MTKKQNTSRRQFLRGASVALGLPILPSLAWASSGRAGEAVALESSPLRTAFIYFPNGVWEKAWVPEKSGADFELTPSLQPLADIRDDVMVLSGLDKQNSHGGDGHYAKTANFLTGMPVAKTTGKNISSGGVSVDQLIAQSIGNETPLPSLELGTEPVISGIDSNVGYTRLYGSHISWQSANRPVAKEINPQIVFERLFGRSGSPLGDQDSAAQRRLLDHVLDDAKTIRRGLGRDDQFKLDEYIDSVRAVERRLEFASRRDGAVRPRPNSVDTLRATVEESSNSFREKIDLMLDMIVLAFQTDSTRVCSFMFANDVSGRNFSFLDGVQGGHHELSHHENNDQKIAQYQKINQWHVAQFARMIAKMKAIPEGDGTLLDHSMVLFGSSFSDGNRHDPDNLPILLGGRGNGAIQPGRHLAAEGQVPLCNLYLAMLQSYGFDLESFGDSTQPLVLS
ncbi:MAG: hypothetical protein ACI87E_000684 [Mariniblastus sp.]|jgi:hypothetical protein